MAKGKGIEIKGLDEVLKAINRELGEKPERIKKEVLHEAGKALQEKVKNKAARMDDGYFAKENLEYGKLEDNIWLEWDGLTKTTYVTTGNAYWARMHEYGTSKTRKHRGWMSKEFRKSQNELLEIVRDELKKRMDLE